MSNVRARQKMPYAKRIVLRSRSGYTSELDAMVEDFLRDGVVLVAVTGKDCAKIEDVIDELVVGDGSDPSRCLITTSHPDESEQGAVEFAKSWSGENLGEVQLVEL